MVAGMIVGMDGLVFKYSHSGRQSTTNAYILPPYCNCSLVDSSLSELYILSRPPTLSYIYSYIFTLGLYQLDIRTFLALEYLIYLL